MARRPRLTFSGALYHVMSRGNRKAMIVEDDDDRRIFMQTLGETAEDCQVRIYACCLMGTHYHVLLDTPRGNVSDFMRALNTQYSKAVNRRHARVGHTFEQRFESRVVQRENYLRRVARYIVLNPVRAGLCRDPAEWPWSSHRATSGLERAPSWLHMDWLRWAFRAESLSDAQARYRAYVQDLGFPGRATRRPHSVPRGSSGPSIPRSAWLAAETTAGFPSMVVALHGSPWSRCSLEKRQTAAIVAP